MNTPVEFDEAPGDDETTQGHAGTYSQAVVHATDWTTETIVSQLRRGNILLNPQFQRRDAWSVQQKARFIESLVMGLPVPQIVLAENPGRRGTYLVLDGKQRLLSLLQYWGLGEGTKNRYALSGLEVVSTLNRKRLADLEHDPGLSDELNSLLNQTIRTVVIRNWPDTDFLHLVFLRLNTGSTRLSPQELRQALQPGPFTDWVDKTAAESSAIKKLMGISEPDSRMRDTEILARYTCFRFFLTEYPGRMKKFLDDGFAKLNLCMISDFESPDTQPSLDVVNLAQEFEDGLEVLMVAFEEDAVARRPGSRLLNRTLLDMLTFYTRSDAVRDAIRSSPDKARIAYRSLFNDSAFVSAIDSDTARTANTVLRLRAWGIALNSTFNLRLPLPDSVSNEKGTERIEIEEF